MPTKPVAAFTHATDANIGSGPAIGFPTKQPVPSPAQGFIPGLGISAQQVNTPLNLTGTWLSDWVLLGTSVADADTHIVETDSIGKIRVALASIGGPLSDKQVFNAENNTDLFQTAVITNHHAGGLALEIMAGGIGLSVLSTTRGAISASGHPSEPVLSLNKAGGVDVRSAIYTQPQNDPSSIVEGDFWIRESFDGIGVPGRSNFAWSDQVNGGTQIINAWGTNKGKFFRSAESLGEQATNEENGANAPTKLTLSVNPGAGGRYKVTFSCAVATTAIIDAQVKVIFDTGIAGKEKEYQIIMPAAAQWMPLSVSWMVDGNASPMVNEIRWYSGQAEAVEIRDAEIIFEGSHDETV